MDAPVLPIHPRCHCAYCVPDEMEDAEVTMSGGDLEAVYARKGVPGYGDGEGAEAMKEYIPKNLQERIDRAANPLIDIVPPMEGGTAEAVAEAPALAGAQTSAEMTEQTREMSTQTREMSTQTREMPADAQTDNVIANAGHGRLVDAQSEYFESATPDEGQFTYDAGYDTAKNAHDIEDAKLLHNTLGGGHSSQGKERRTWCNDA